MKKFVSMFLALAMCLTLAAPVFAAEEAHTQTSTNNESVYYLQECDEGYRLIDFSSAYSIRSNSDNVVAVELTNGEVIYQSADQRCFYQATSDLFLEVGWLEIPETCEFSAEEIQTEYNLPDYVAERVYDILYSRNLNDSVKVYSSELMRTRNATRTYTGYNGNTYQDYLIESGIDTDYVEMFNSDNESETSMRSKRITISVEWVASEILSTVSKGVFSLVQLGVDLSNSGIIHNYRTWKHSVGMRGTQIDKLTSIRLGDEYMYGARTTRAEWDFVELVDGGKGQKIETYYSQEFTAETPSYSDPSELCYWNYFNGGKAEWLQNVKHGSVTFAIS